MSWMRDNGLTLLQLLAVKVMKSGHVPKHIAFIMDGNRRYAKKMNSSRAVDGHVKGFDKLAETLQWCLDLGVSQVTVYAFSIENFRRSQEEVDDLMNLIREKIKRLLDEREKLQQRGVRIRVLGNLFLLPKDVVQMLAEGMEITKNNNKAFLNVAISYTSTDEITRAIQDVARGVKNGHLQAQDIDEDVLTKCLDTESHSVPDLLIRTSAEVRLSDYLMWQSSSTCIYFCGVLWPEFSIWDLLKAVFHYQRSRKELQTVRNQHWKNTVSHNQAKSSFVDNLHQSRQLVISRMSQCAVQS